MNFIPVVLENLGFIFEDCLARGGTQFDDIIFKNQKYAFIVQILTLN